MNPNFLSSPVEEQAATSTQLYIALILLSLTLISILIQYIRLVRTTRKKYSLRQAPFSYVITIYTGLLLVIVNELIILFSIIVTNQETTYLGREKAIFIVMGLGFFIYGWTRLLHFNLSLRATTNRVVGIAFLGAMAFYAFAVVITILITFQVVKTHTFLGIGYPTAVAIYGTFLLIDLATVIYIANRKRKQSNYQAWIGILLFSSLFLNFLSIIFNAIPLIIVGRVAPKIHVIFNYLVEPGVYFVATTFSLLFLYWILFNPSWLQQRSIEQES